MGDFLPVGLHMGIPHDRYHADPCERPSLSAHIAMELIKHSAGHAAKIHPRIGGERHAESNGAMDTGSLLHGLILGGGAPIVEVDAKAWNTNDAKAKRDEAMKAGKIAVLAHKFARIQTTAAAIRKVLPVDIGAADTEVTAIWESDGTPCRARIDALFPALIHDLKFTDDATVAGADRNIAASGYHIQAAADIDAIETLFPTLAGRVRFVLTFIEWENPEIGIMQREIRGQLLDVGRKQWNRAKAIWGQCLASKAWPGYSTEIVEAQCPPWVASGELQAQIDNQRPPF